MMTEDEKYWIERGPKAAAFLLVIPGTTIIGYGIGMLSDHTIQASIIGLGVGLFAWGLIVSFRK